MTTKRVGVSLPEHRSANAPAPPERDRIVLLLDLAIAVLVLLVLVTVAAGAVLHRSDRILPGVASLGVPLRGMSTVQAADTLQASWTQRTITLETADVTLSTSPALLGLTLDAEATAADAYRQSRTSAALERALLRNEPMTVPPVWSLDSLQARSYLEAIAPQFAVAPVDAGFRVVDGRAVVTPATPGRALDVAATLDWLHRNAPQVVEDGRVPLVLRPVEPAIADVSIAVDQAKRLFANQLTIRAYDPVSDERLSWTVPAEEWSTWLTYRLEGGASSELTWSVDELAVRAFLNARTAETLGGYRRFDVDTAAPALVRALIEEQWSVDLRVYHGEREHVVQGGETLSAIGRRYGIPYPWIQEANPDLGDSLSVGQTIIIPSPDELLPLPIVENRRIVVDIGEQRMWAYEDGALRWEWPVSTGIDSSPTAPGVFQVQSHEPNAYAGRWDLWMPHFLGIYRPVPTSDFMNGFHGFPTRNGSTLLWTDDLGHPVTYGCILVSSENAQALYEWAEEGVVVEVRE